MKTKSPLLIALLTLLHVTPLFAIENLRISVVASNVVLSWPSKTNEAFIVEYRATLNTNTPWVMLASNHPAKAATNWTTFTHSNIVQYPAPCTNSGGGSFTGPPTFGLMMAGGGGAMMMLGLEGIIDPEDLLPYPWNPLYQKSSSALSFSSASGEGGAQTQSSSESSCPSVASMGFYRVVRAGLHIVGMTNGMTIAGNASFPVEVGVLSSNKPILSLDVSALEAAESRVQFVPEKGYWMALWNSPFTPNGTWNVSLRASLPFYEPARFSPPQTQIVSNDMMFETFSSKFGDALLVYAILAASNLSYSVDLYGETNNLIRSFSGIATNNYIIHTWNLRDSNNTLRSDQKFTGVFTLAAAGANSKKRTYTKGKGGAGDAFVVAWAQSGVAANTATRLGDMMQQYVVDILNSPAADFPYELSPGNSWNGTTFRATSATKSNLVATLSDNNYGNFYFFGHGSPHGIAASGYFENDPFRLSKAEMDEAFGTNRMDYRFVFIDSCDAGAARLCEVFGIRREQVSRNTYAALGLKANAFLGATALSPLPGTATQFNQYGLTLATFFNEWMNNYTLNGSLLRAQQVSVWPISTNVVIWGAPNLYRFYQQP